MMRYRIEWQGAGGMYAAEVDDFGNVKVFLPGATYATPADAPLRDLVLSLVDEGLDPERGPEEYDA